MYAPQSLTENQLVILKNTISSNAFYLIVCDALVSKKPLSVVRFADGEKILYEMCLDNLNDDVLQPNNRLSKEWFDRMGVTGITKKELHSRFSYASRFCTYAAPSISGITMPNYDVYDMMPDYIHQRYVDNFFPNAWFRDMRENIFKQAKHVVVIHGNTEMIEAMQYNAKKYLGVKVTHVKLTNWQQADDVCKKVIEMDAPLVLYSSGPASKHIGVEIASGSCHTDSYKVCLDIGQAMHKFTFDWLAEKHLQTV